MDCLLKDPDWALNALANVFLLKSFAPPHLHIRDSRGILFQLPELICIIWKFFTGGFFIFPLIPFLGSRNDDVIAAWSRDRMHLLFWTLWFIQSKIDHPISTKLILFTVLIEFNRIELIAKLFEIWSFWNQPKLDIKFLLKEFDQNWPFKNQPKLEIDHPNSLNQ